MSVDVKMHPVLSLAIQDIGDALTRIAAVAIATHATGIERGAIPVLLEQAATRIRKLLGTGEGALGSKINPGKFDCHAIALPDEPVFALLGRDDSAPTLVEAWADLREHAIKFGERPESDMEKVAEAREWAKSARKWRQYRHGAWRVAPEEGVENLTPHLTIEEADAAKVITVIRLTSAAAAAALCAAGTPAIADEPIDATPLTGAR